jgi:hypothetical protein
MRISLAPIVATLFASAAFILAPSARAAAIPACGNLDFSANANCELVTSGGCTAQCEPINFTAQCSAELYVSCDGQCNASADVNCTASCEASCEGKCTVDPGKFDCSASCQADCSASCDAQCNASADAARCKASCKSTCSGTCDARCQATPPSADCKAKCQGSCSGSCEAKANLSCQVNCQSKGYASCETSLTGGCQTQCSKPDGALFCDGQYVDVGDQLDKCVEQLKSALNIEVKGYAYGDANCSNGTCTANGEAGVSCMARPGMVSGGAAFGVFGVVTALGFAASRRRRKA